MTKYQPFQLLIEEWLKNARLWLRKLKATDMRDISYRNAIFQELRRCIRRIRDLKKLQAKEMGD